MKWRLSIIVQKQSTKGVQKIRCKFTGEHRSMLKCDFNNYNQINNHTQTCFEIEICIQIISQNREVKSPNFQKMAYIEIAMCVRYRISLLIYMYVHVQNLKKILQAWES